VFDIKNLAPEVPYEKVEYIPKAPVIEHLKNLEAEQADKVAKYKQYAIDLKSKYQKFEFEAQRHYAQILKKHQKQTDELLSKKEDMFYKLKVDNEEAEKELVNMRNKLYKAQQEGKFEVEE